MVEIGFHEDGWNYPLIISKFSITVLVKEMWVVNQRIQSDLVFLSLDTSTART